MDEQYFAERVELVNEIIEKLDHPVDFIALAASLINEVIEQYNIELEHVLQMIKEGIEYANEEEDDD